MKSIKIALLPLVVCMLGIGLKGKIKAFVDYFQ
jgi:hypothetical protein